MITAQQIKMARAALDWTRERLEEESGVSLSTIANLEQGRISNPNTKTLRKLEQTFTKYDIGFRDGGAFPGANLTKRFEGEDWYLQVLDDVYETLIDEKDPEVIVLFCDERHSTKEVIARWRKIRNLGAKIRRVVRDGDTHLTGALSEYRYMPAKFFNNHLIVIYENRVVISDDTDVIAISFKSTGLVRTLKLLTGFLFSVLKEPKESTADERI